MALVEFCTCFHHTDITECTVEVRNALDTTETNITIILNQIVVIGSH